MKKLDKQTAQALTNLRGNPNFDQVVKWLGEHREKFRDECSTSDGPPLYRSQGKAQLVDDILKDIGQAPEVTDKFKKQER